MVVFAELFHVLLSFLPPWFEIAVALIIGIMLFIAVFKLVAFVMDVLPFV